MDLTSLSQMVLAQTTADPSLQEGGVTFTKLFLRYESLMITSASWVIIQAAQKSLGKIMNHPIAVRLKPITPVLLSLAMAFMPSFRLGSWDETLLYGVTLGSLTGFGQKILKQTLFGQDYRIKPVIEDPELRQKIDEHLKTNGKTDGDGHSRKRLREKIRHLVT